MNARSREIAFAPFINDLTLLYHCAKRLANLQKRRVTDVLTGAIMLDNTADLLTYEPDEAVELSLRPSLWQNYPGYHVAIYQGQNL